MTARLNHVAVVVAAVVFFLWGWIWFTIFGGAWMAYVGKTTSGLGPLVFVVSFLCGWVVAYVTAIALADSENPNMVRHGIEFGLFFGIGIWAVLLLNAALYLGWPLGLWALEAFYPAIGMAMMGAIIGGWRK
ncbi:MAG: DUF1761 family protein [Candidatus Eremiobacteraeota bacterium]|nr:DUF1761 family protein [Candidatus Eremiobacteraeota bacterium]